MFQLTKLHALAFLIFAILVILDLGAVYYVVAFANKGVTFFSEMISTNYQIVIVFVAAALTTIIGMLIVTLISFTRLRTYIVLVFGGLIVYFLIRVGSPIADMSADPSLPIGMIMGILNLILVYGPAVWFYFRFRMPFFAVALISVMYMSTLLIAQAAPLASQLEPDSLLKPDIMVISVLFYALSAMLLLIDNSHQMARWAKTPRNPIFMKLGSFILLVLVLFGVTLFTNAYSARIWRVAWREANGVNEHISEDQLKKGEEGGAGNLNSDGDSVTMNPNQPLQDSIKGGKWSEADDKILFTVKILEQQKDYDVVPGRDAISVTGQDFNEQTSPHYWKIEELGQFSSRRGFYNELNYGEFVNKVNLNYEGNEPGSYLFEGYLSSNDYNEAGGKELNQQIVFNDLSTYWLVAEERPSSVRLLGGRKRDLYELYQGSWVTELSRPWGRGDSYVVRSLTSWYDPHDTFDRRYMAQYSDDQLAVATYPEYSKFNNKKIQELALEVTDGATSNVEKSYLIEKWFNENFKYTLNPGPPRYVSERTEGLDRIEYFLFESREGYCTYFASSMVAMLRSILIPSRVAVGFAQGDYDEQLDAYVVRAKHAHAWVEVYIEGFGWIPFEPTSSDTVEGGQNQPKKRLSQEERKELEKLQRESDRNRKNLDRNEPPKEEREPFETPRWLEELIPGIDRFIVKTFNFLKYFTLFICSALLLGIIFIPPLLNLYVEQDLRGKLNQYDERKRIVNLFKLLEKRVRRIDRSLSRGKGEDAHSYIAKVAAFEAISSDEVRNLLEQMAQIYNRAYFRHKLESGDMLEMESAFEKLLVPINLATPWYRKLIGYWIS